MKAAVCICALLFSGFAQSQNLEEVKRYTRILADSTFYGRGYVLDGSNKAAQFIKEEFQSLGLEPVGAQYEQQFSLAVNTFPVDIVLTCNGNELKEGQDFILNPASGRAAGKYRTVHPNVQADHILKPEKYAKRIAIIDLEGKDTPEELGRIHEFKKQLLTHGPVILLQPDKLTWSVRQTQEYEYPEFEILKSSWTNKNKKCDLLVRNKEIQYQANNIIGMIPGKRSDSTIVLTAHYDHLGMLGEALFPGASDNASGTAMLLDFAAHYSQNPPEFDTYFIAFAAEEVGLLGSKYFVDNPTIDLSRIKFLINLDLMGSAADGIAIVNGKAHPEAMSLMGHLNKTGPNLGRIKVRGQAPNSDHYWFAEENVPSIFIYTMGNSKAYHDVYDVPEAIDWSNYEEVFRLILEFLEAI
jgi:hypothetical protein